MGRQGVDNVDVSKLDMLSVVRQASRYAFEHMSASVRIAAVSQKEPEHLLAHVHPYSVQGKGDWP